MQNLRWQVRVRAASKEQASVAVRKHSFQAGAPLHFDEEYESITTLEFLLGALGADLVNGLRLLARKRRVHVDTVEATVQGELNNPLTFLGVVGEEGHPGLRKIQIKVYISSLNAVEEIQQLWDETLRRSPLVCTLRPAVDLDIDYKIVL